MEDFAQEVEAAKKGFLVEKMAKNAFCLPNVMLSAHPNGSLCFLQEPPLSEFHHKNEGAIEQLMHKGGTFTLINKMIEKHVEQMTDAAASSNSMGALALKQDQRPKSREPRDPAPRSGAMICNTSQVPQLATAAIVMVVIFQRLRRGGPVLVQPWPNSATSHSHSTSDSSKVPDVPADTQLGGRTYLLVPAVSSDHANSGFPDRQSSAWSLPWALAAQVPAKASNLDEISATSYGAKFGEEIKGLQDLGIFDSGPPPSTSNIAPQEVGHWSLPTAMEAPYNIFTLSHNASQTVDNGVATLPPHLSDDLRHTGANFIRQLLTPNPSEFNFLAHQQPAIDITFAIQRKNILATVDSENLPEHPLLISHEYNLVGAPRRISENPNPADLENVPSLSFHWNFLEEQDHPQPEGPSPQNIQLLQEELERLQKLQNSIHGAIDAYSLLQLDATLPPDWGARTFQPKIQADQANRKAMMALYWAEMEDQSQARYGAYFDHLAFPTAQGGAEVLEFRTPLEDPMVLRDLLPYTRQMADARNYSAIILACQWQTPQNGIPFVTRKMDSRSQTSQS
ncbi:hypothetical protein FPV67DRAFT_1451980 [Lyophyllum atratum]|nr:hypothetical protein FPV67DRAFT_1451980 [Lyophyllum atratum]